MQTVNTINKESHDYFVGIDIGSSMIVMAVGRKNDDGTIHIVAIETQQSVGVSNGMIDNVIHLGKAIKNAKEAIEQSLDIRIEEAYVGLSGEAVYGTTGTDFVYVRDTQNQYITQDDKRELHDRMSHVSTSNSDEIIDRIPLQYVLDNKREVDDPVGCCSSTLSASYLFLVCDHKQKNHLDQALHYAGIRLKGICINAAVAPGTLLTKEEMDGGAAVVNIGSHLTDISIVRDGHLCHIASLPIGADAINNDLREFCKGSPTAIERLKKGRCAAIYKESEVVENSTVNIKMMHNTQKPILVANIMQIAEARMQAIAGWVLRELKNAKYSQRLQCGIVLTGGGAQLAYADELFARELNIPTRLADTLHGFDEATQENITATDQFAAVSIIKFGVDSGAACRVLVKEEKVPHIVEKGVTDLGFDETKTIPTPPTRPTPPTTPVPGNGGHEDERPNNDNVAEEKKETEEKKEPEEKVPEKKEPEEEKETGEDDDDTNNGTNQGGKTKKRSFFGGIVNATSHFLDILISGDNKPLKYDE